MKSIITSLSILLLSTQLSAQNGLLQNSSFENWQMVSHFEDPTDWDFTSNSLSSDDSITVLRSSDAHSGSWSCLLDTKVSGNDTISGLVSLGNISMLPHGPAYSDPIDSIIGWWKYDCPAGDSVRLDVVAWSGGTPTGNAFYAGTPTSSWTRFSYPISVASPDSIAIEITAPKPTTGWSGQPGSWLMLDDLEFVASSGTPSPIPNGDFEQWTMKTTNEPDSWYTLNRIWIPANMVTAEQTSDAWLGASAIKLTNKSFHGILLNAYTGPGYLKDGSPQGIAYDAMPTSLDGYYKFTNSGTDSAGIFVEFRNGGNTIFTNELWFYNTTTMYNPFNIPINLPSQPDTVIVTFFAGFDPSTELYIDDVQFSGGDVGLPEQATSQITKVYPNPASDIVYIDHGSMQVELIEIHDVQGRLVRQIQFNPNDTKSINLEGLERGTYHVKLSERNGSSESHSIVVE